LPRRFRELNPLAPRVDTSQARTATFYSISNTERGLSGIPFGNALISTPSRSCVRTAAPAHVRYPLACQVSPAGYASWVKRVDADVRTASDPCLAPQTGTHATLREPLLRLAARYLLAASAQRCATRRGRTLSPRNGATIERLDWLADPTARDRAVVRNHGELRYGSTVTHPTSSPTPPITRSTHVGGACARGFRSDVLDDPVPIVSRRHALLSSSATSPPREAPASARPAQA